jgi:malate permease and related proteins
MLAELFTIVAPVFICAGLGFGWSRLGRVYDTEQTTALVTTIGAPCLAFHTLANLSAGAAQLGSMAAIAATAIVSCALLGTVVLRLARLPTRTFLPSLMFGNTGNMGLPLAFLAFGDQGLQLAIGVFVVHSITMFTVGVALASGRLSLTGLARIPLLYAVAAALAFMFTGMRPPTWLNATTDLLGGITIPLMLFTLGTSLARLRVANLKLSAALAAVRLVLGFTVALGLVTLLSVEGPARGVLILQLSMPVAVFNYLFAQRYGQRPSDVAAVVVLSTALSFITLPALLWFVL